MIWTVYEQANYTKKLLYDSKQVELVFKTLTIDDIISTTKGLLDVNVANLFSQILIVIDEAITKGDFQTSFSTNESLTLVDISINQLNKLGFTTNINYSLVPSVQIDIGWNPESIEKDTIAWDFYKKTHKVRDSFPLVQASKLVKSQKQQDKCQHTAISHKEENLITAAEARSIATTNSTRIFGIYNRLLQDIMDAINNSIAKGKYETFINLENNQDQNYQESINRIIKLLSDKGYSYNYDKMCLVLKW